MPSLMAAEGVARSDAQATNSAAARRFYKSRVPIYPKLVHGTFRKVKWAAMAVLLAIYYLVPWIRWDRGPGAAGQAVLVDLAHERFYFFFIEIWPQEVYYVTGLLILAAIGLFLATALFGRIWCGYACPQTVWTDLFIYVEDLIEGDRSARIRSSKEPRTATKIAKRASKHAVWLLIALATGGAWIFYFADAPTLARSLVTGESSPIIYAFIGLFTFTTYSLAGLMREQVCIYMCPWPRIQAAMTDAEALSVTYRTDRGEPRGPHKKGQSWESRGSCIDCNQCVAACPMGIDIRDGLQLECINCALCIDACDEVLLKIGQPKGLIGYDTDLNLQRRAKGEKARFRFVRPRTIVYAALLLAVGAVMLVSLSTRATVGLDAIRDRNPNFVVLADGSVRNGYMIKVLNRGAEPRTFLISIEGPKISAVRIIGLDDAKLPARIAVEADKVRTLRVLITVAGHDLHTGSQEIEFTVADPKIGERHETASVFVSGEPRS
ncbi:MAG: cytochrome c oxidase accessory protein CcoG [Proteobacteria bacterium]|nr:cytochrome c oxidase accessory protein CcoG [Pseudomonadota bacterium]